MKRRLLIAVFCLMIFAGHVFLGTLTEQVNKKNDFVFLRLKSIEQKPDVVFFK